MQNNQSANINPTPHDQIFQEHEMKAKSGIPTLAVNIIGIIIAIAVIVFAIIFRAEFTGHTLAAIIVACSIYIVIIAPIFLCGVRIMTPAEARVFTYFGKYHGTLKGPGTFYVNALLYSTYAPPAQGPTSAEVAIKSAISAATDSEAAAAAVSVPTLNHKISLKTKTINNNKQKVNDLLGNPIIIDTMVVWRIIDTAKAIFNVDNYMEYLSVQCDAALRNIVSLYPYDAPSDSTVKSLRGSSHEIADALKEAIQASVEIAGLEIIDASITNLSYAPEIASAMLQRQQATAVVDAKHTIVEGAVDIVEMALRRLNANDIVHLDEERKAAMVSNLLVVLCGNKEATPVVNSGSLY